MKRNCGFLSESVAKRLKIDKNVEQLVNSFNLKPRDYYIYIHGSPPKHAAFELCLTAIKNAGGNIGWTLCVLNIGSRGRENFRHLICKFAQHNAWRLQSCRRVGAVFSEDTNVTIRKADLLCSLVENHHYNNDEDPPSPFYKRFLGRIPTELRPYFWT